MLWVSHHAPEMIYRLAYSLFHYMCCVGLKEAHVESIPCCGKKECTQHTITLANFLSSFSHYLIIYNPLSHFHIVMHHPNHYIDVPMDSFSVISSSAH